MYSLEHVAKVYLFVFAHKHCISFLEDFVI